MRALIILTLLAVAMFGQTAPDKTVSGAGAANLPETPASTQEKPPPKGQIAGQVVNDATGAPLRKATVRARRTDGNSQESVEATTDADGKFKLDDLDPGKYSLDATRNGYVNQKFGAKSDDDAGTILNVGPGGSVEANFKLTQHSVVTGRVVDEDGEPVVRASVNLKRFRWIEGKRTLMPGENTWTNDLGEYRFFGVAPGRYYASVTYNPGNWNDARPSGQAPEGAYPTIYYPGTPDSASATKVEVPRSGQLNGIDFALQKVKSYTVSGRVVSGVPGQSKPAHAMVVLIPNTGDSAGSWDSNRMGQIDAEGKFTFKAVLPGAYKVSAHSWGGDAATSARETATVSNANLSGVTLRLTPGFEMKGTVRVEGDAPPANINGIALQLSEEEITMVYYGAVPNAAPHDDGSFTLKDIEAQRYRLRVWNLPEGYYLKAARAGSADLLGRVVDFTALNGASIDVVLSPKGATVEGSVKDDKDEPVTNGTVVLVPEPSKRADHDLYRSGPLDQYGHYKLRGIPPGSYTVYAFKDVEAGIWEDPDFLKTVEKDAVEVSVTEGAKKSTDLKLVVTAPTS